MYESKSHPINYNGIKELKKKIHIGSRIVVRTFKGLNLVTNGETPGKIEVERTAIVTGCYPFGVTARIEKSGVVDSMTWVELEMRRRRYGRVGR